jgi:preprotein translocase subunit SecA
MKARIEEDIVRYVFHMRAVATTEEPQLAVPAPRRATPMILSKPAVEPVPAFAGARVQAAAAMPEEAMAVQGRGPVPARTGGDDVIKTVRRDEPKVGRNDPCPCGSGKKYKKCHGAAA